MAPVAPMAGRSLLAAEPRARRVVETGHDAYRQRLVLAGEGRGTVIREGGRVGAEGGMR
ncbi:hypothetical protein LPC08_00640 [Roseomonas sp. OT10]|uniref:hypothetical protein n=1 Tax=Roseomonas cutis TaxID=2897332 RepID=UPI001E48527D|nr:hypothetical protein [Roseomonas sp. OT10]UFN49187.1 hypothetical protein LPC08_00640 [Roseomonas sp. OT10]